MRHAHAHAHAHVHVHVHVHAHLHVHVHVLVHVLVHVPVHASCARVLSVKGPTSGIWRCSAYIYAQSRRGGVGPHQRPQPAAGATVSWLSPLPGRLEHRRNQPAAHCPRRAPAHA